MIARRCIEYPLDEFNLSVCHDREKGAQHKNSTLGRDRICGSALLGEALRRGHRITAIVRYPEKLPEQEGLVAQAGDVNDFLSLAKLIQGHDALMSSRQPGKRIYE